MYPPGANTACWGKRSTTPPAKHSTRWRTSSAWAIPEARRSSGWRATVRPGQFRLPRPMLQELDRGRAQPLRLLVQRAQDRRAPGAASRPSRESAVTPAERGRSRPGVSGRSHRGAGRQDRARGRAPSATAQAMVGGGVACNRALVSALKERLAGRGPGQRSFPAAQHRQRGDDRSGRAPGDLHRGERSGWDLEPRDDLPHPGPGARLHSLGTNT